MTEKHGGVSCRPPGARAPPPRPAKRPRTSACLRLLLVQAALFVAPATLAALDMDGLGPAAVLALAALLVIALPAAGLLAGVLREGAPAADCAGVTADGRHDASAPAATETPPDPVDAAADAQGGDWNGKVMAERNTELVKEQHVDLTIPNEDITCELAPCFVPRLPNKPSIDEAADEKPLGEVPQVSFESRPTVATTCVFDGQPGDEEDLWWLPETVCVEDQSGWQQARLPCPDSRSRNASTPPRLLAVLETKAQRLDKLLAVFAAQHCMGDALDSARLVVSELIEGLRPWAMQPLPLVALQSSEIVLSVDFDFACTAMADTPYDFDVAVSHAASDAPEPEPTVLTRPPAGFDGDDPLGAAIQDDGIQGEIPSPERFRAEHARQRRDVLLQRLRQCHVEIEETELRASRRRSAAEDTAEDQFGSLRRRRDKLCEQLRLASTELADALLELGEEEEPRNIPAAFTLGPTVHNIMHVTRVPPPKKKVSVDVSVVKSRNSGFLSCGCGR